MRAHGFCPKGASDWRMQAPGRRRALKSESKASILFTQRCCTQPAPPATARAKHPLQNAGIGLGLTIFSSPLSHLLNLQVLKFCHGEIFAPTLGSAKGSIGNVEYNATIQ